MTLKSCTMSAGEIRVLNGKAPAVSHIGTLNQGENHDYNILSRPATSYTWWDVTVTQRAQTQCPWKHTVVLSFRFSPLLLSVLAPGFVVQTPVWESPARSFHWIRTQGRRRLWHSKCYKRKPATRDALTARTHWGHCISLYTGLELQCQTAFVCPDGRFPFVSNWRHLPP